MKLEKLFEPKNSRGDSESNNSVVIESNKDYEIQFFQEKPENNQNDNFEQKQIKTNIEDTLLILEVIDLEILQQPKHSSGLLSMEFESQNSSMMNV